MEQYQLLKPIHTLLKTKDSVASHQEVTTLYFKPVIYSKERVVVNKIANLIHSARTDYAMRNLALIKQMQLDTKEELQNTIQEDKEDIQGQVESLKLWLVNDYFDKFFELLESLICRGIVYKDNEYLTILNQADIQLLSPQDYRGLIFYYIATYYEDFFLL